MIGLGEMAVVMDCHVGIGDDQNSYALHPGDSGLVVSIEDETAGLLMAGCIVYVRIESLECLRN